MEDNQGSRREAILQAAHRLFIQQGYHGTSMRQIASQSGIALGGLYNYFPSKEEVFRAVLIENHPYREVLPALLAAQGDDIGSLVRDAADRLLRSLENRPDFLNLMFIELVEFNSNHVGELFSMLFPQVLGIAQRMQNLGGEKLRPIPIPILIRSFLGLFFSYYMTEIVIKPFAPPDFTHDAMDHFVEIYLHGILVVD